MRLFYDRANSRYVLDRALDNAAPEGEKVHVPIRAALALERAYPGEFVVDKAFFFDHDHHSSLSVNAKELELIADEVETAIGLTDALGEWLKGRESLAALRDAVADEARDSDDMAALSGALHLLQQRGEGEAV